MESIRASTRIKRKVSGLQGMRCAGAWEMERLMGLALSPKRLSRQADRVTARPYPGSSTRWIVRWNNIEAGWGPRPCAYQHHNDDGQEADHQCGQHQQDKQQRHDGKDHAPTLHPKKQSSAARASPSVRRRAPVRSFNGIVPVSVNSWEKNCLRWHLWQFQPRGAKGRRRSTERLLKSAGLLGGAFELCRFSASQPSSLPTRQPC